MCRDAKHILRSLLNLSDARWSCEGRSVVNGLSYGDSKKDSRSDSQGVDVSRSTNVHKRKRDSDYAHYYSTEIDELLADYYDFPCRYRRTRGPKLQFNSSIHTLPIKLSYSTAHFKRANLNPKLMTAVLGKVNI